MRGGDPCGRPRPLPFRIIILFDNQKYHYMKDHNNYKVGRFH